MENVTKAPPITSDYISEFETDIRRMINKHSRENMSDTPDYVLAKFLDSCLMAFSVAVSQRDFYYKFIPQKPIDIPDAGR